MRRTSILLVLAAALSAVQPASADTICTLGSPTPGFKVIRLDLPQGSDYIGIELNGARATRPVDDGSSWHFARGIMVFTEDLDLVTYRISNSGSTPKTYTVAADDQRVQQTALGVDGPFVHNASSLVPRLAPGVYYAVAFGVDGSRNTPNEYWSADVRVQGAVPCTSAAVGETFDLNHTDSEEGTQVYAPGIGVAEDGELLLESSRQVSIGLIDCSVQFTVETDDDEGVGEAGCDVELSNGATMSVEDSIVPFLTGPGASEIDFEFAGVAPVIAVSGASFTLTR